MEFHEVHHFLNQEKDRLNSSTTATTGTTERAEATAFTTATDINPPYFIDDDSFDSDDDKTILHNELSRPRELYQLSQDTPSLSLLHHRQRHYSRIPMERLLLPKHRSNTSLSRVFVASVRQLKRKVISLSPSTISSSSEDSSYSSSDEYKSWDLSSSTHPHDITHSPGTPSLSNSRKLIQQEQYQEQEEQQQEQHDSSVHQLDPPALSPIPKPVSLVPSQQQISISPSPTHRYRSRRHRLRQHQLFVSSYRNDAALAKISGVPSSNRFIHTSPTSSSSSPTTKRSRVRSRLGSIWNRRFFRPTTVTPTSLLLSQSPSYIGTDHHRIYSRGTDSSDSFNTVIPSGHYDRNSNDTLTTSFDPSQDFSLSSLEVANRTPDLSTLIRSPSMLLAQVSENIQKLQCLIDIEVQLVEDHRRDVSFYTNQLEQLDHDVQFLNTKVLDILGKVDTEMIPVQEEMQRMIPLLDQAQKVHHIIINRFTKRVFQIKARNTFELLRKKTISAQQQIKRWNTFTYWGYFVSLILLSWTFLLWSIYSVGFTFTCICIVILTLLFYDTS
ncbi:uncharacterized protein BX664DRAFT_340320 [Halteromyces radiatus]|uniref:uncharacterized protein n=1 Tax=Halteromyces radiatus TaxID=101107 RepID=UPI00221F47CD|nr:uncharacterized protein BX664DRAFT_340320 [Halteromyces radiatus]KAI8081402.1 hypothetical protein BX664DRAFT_340320 [Halteromyces radiatus]